jgi:hypothetical protein
MSANSNHKGLDLIDSSRAPSGARLLLVAISFLAFEATFIWTLGDKLYDFSYFSPAFWGLLALASVGYFGLGFFSRTWQSGFALVGPLLVALYFVNVVWTTDLGDGTSVATNSNFVAIWFTLSVVFLPAWVLGVRNSRNQ